MVNSSKVLIVGAGPVGLTLALILKHYGITPYIIEQAVERSPFSKALTLTSASLKVFQGLGLAEAMIAAGRPCRRAEVYFQKRRVAFLDKQHLSSCFNYYLSLSQPKTEHILEQAAINAGVTIHYGHKLVNVVHEPVGAIAEIISATQQYQKHFDYVIGCDGAHSQVRHCLKLASNGPNYPVHFLIADVILARGSGPACATYYVNHAGFMGLFPVETGCLRTVIQQDGILKGNEVEVTEKVLQAIFDEQLPNKLQIQKCIWSSRARMVGRIAEHCRQNRVFLVGDAWHLFSSIGGQTLNTGLQDVMDLGWKLAYVINGLAGEILLDTYETQRKIAAEKVLKLTDTYMNLITGCVQNPSLSECFMPSFRNRPFFKETLPQLFSGYHADWNVDEASWVGRHVPYFAIKTIYEGINSTYDLPRLRQYILLQRDDNMLLQQQYSKSVVSIVLDNMGEWEQVLPLKLGEQCLISPGGYIVAYGRYSVIETYCRHFLLGR